ncbi:MAG: phosphoribulokinase [Chloroflexaceae bacterium]|nr:phosphoribulokinase [Chloroflexaceae bacterium]
MPYRPVILGVVGDSAAGKTTISAGIASILGEDRVTVICTDDYHRYNRKQRSELNISALHPDCNYIDIMEQHLRCLAAGEPILKPVYNHQTGDFDPPEYVCPREFLILEGLLGFATPTLRNAYHVKVYLDPPEQLRRQWKIKRDTSKRNYTTEQVLMQLNKRERDSAEFIRPQRKWADMVVQFYAPRDSSDSEHLNVQLTLRSTLAHPDLSDVISEGSNNGEPALRLRVGRDEGRLTEFLDIEGRVTTEQAMAIEDTIWSHLPELQNQRPLQIGTFVEGQVQRHSHTLGLTQLLIAYHLLVGRLEKERTVTEERE